MKTWLIITIEFTTFELLMDPRKWVWADPHVCWRNLKARWKAPNHHAPLLFLQSVFRSIGGRDPSLPNASPPFQCTWVYHLRYVIFHFYCYCNVLIFSWMWKPTGIRVHSCLKHLSLTYLIWSPRIACQQSWHSPIYVSGASVDT